MFQTNGNKRTRIAIHIQKKIDFRSKTVTSDKEGHNIMRKWSVHQEALTIITIDAHNIGAPKYINQILTNLKRVIHKNTIIVGTLVPHFQQ